MSGQGWAGEQAVQWHIAFADRLRMTCRRGSWDGAEVAWGMANELQPHLKDCVVEEGFEAALAQSPRFICSFQLSGGVRQQLQQPQRHLHRYQLPPMLPVILWHHRDP